MSSQMLETPFYLELINNLGDDKSTILSFTMMSHLVLVQYNRCVTDHTDSSNGSIVWL